MDYFNGAISAASSKVVGPYFVTSLPDLVISNLFLTCY